MIGKLYEIERYAKNESLPPDKVKELRLEKSKQILVELEVWLHQHIGRAPPKHPLGKAIRYCLNNWSALTRYLEDDGRLDIDNNACERAIRPFAVGRKNWLFMGNERGCQAGAVIYSLIETCKANDIDPYKYLRYVLKKIPTATKLAQLLPYHCNNKDLDDLTNGNVGVFKRLRRQQFSACHVYSPVFRGKELIQLMMVF